MLVNFHFSSGSLVGFHPLLMQSGSRGAATIAARLVVSRDYIKKCGSLSFNVMDEYTYLR